LYVGGQGVGDVDVEPAGGDDPAIVASDGFADNDDFADLAVNGADAMDY
jgi:hypothetical protein